MDKKTRLLILSLKNYVSQGDWPQSIILQEKYNLGIFTILLLVALTRAGRNANFCIDIHTYWLLIFIKYIIGVKYDMIRYYCRTIHNKVGLLEINQFVEGQPNQQNYD